MGNEKAIKGLREFADFLEKNPDFEIGIPRIGKYLPTKESWEKAIKSLGSFNKFSDSCYIGALKEFSGGLQLEVYTGKEITCRKVLKGYKHIDARPETVIPAEPAKEEPIYEWECPQSFLKDEKENAPLPA